MERAFRSRRAAKAERVVPNPSCQGAEAVVLDLLVSMGFTVQSVVPVDMMPQTNLIEALALLSRG